MQSKFPSEYFVFLKSAGLICLVTDCDAAVFWSASVLARFRVRGAGTPGVSGLLNVPPPHPHFGLETLAICRVDVGRGREKVEDLRRTLFPVEVYSEEFIKKTRVARKSVRSLHPPSPDRCSVATFSGPCAGCLQFPTLSPFLTPLPFLDMTFYDLFRNKQTDLQDNPTRKC